MTHPEILVSVVLVVVLVAGTLLLGSRVLPSLIDRVASGGRRDLLLLTILGLGFGLSILSSMIGISVAAGALLAGVLVAESKTQGPAREMVTPLKELFGAIFFVSIGALMNFGLLAPYLFLVVAFVAVSLGVKFLVTYLAARSQGIGPATAERTAIAIAGPRGELSLVVAKGGADVQATAPFTLPTVGAVTLVTSILTPFLLRATWRAAPSVPTDPTPRPPP